jgi:hypothetical protein
MNARGIGYWSKRAFGGLCCALWALLGGRSATAQEIADSVQLRSDCRLAAQVLRSGEPATHRSWAFRVIQSCDDEAAAAAISTVWQAPPTDPDDLSWLVAGSIAHRDARILEAVMTVARDPGASVPLRIAALRVLVSYADRRVWVSLADLESRRALILPFTDHPSGRDGAVPLPPDVTARILATFTDLGASDPNPSIREAAQFLSRAFPRP